MILRVIVASTVSTERFEGGLMQTRIVRYGA
jgi:hypothetical protein